MTIISIGGGKWLTHYGGHRWDDKMPPHNLLPVLGTLPAPQWTGGICEDVATRIKNFAKKDICLLMPLTCEPALSPRVHGKSQNFPNQVHCWESYDLYCGFAVSTTADHRYPSALNCNRCLARIGPIGGATEKVVPGTVELETQYPSQNPKASGHSDDHCMYYTFQEAFYLPDM